MRRLAWIAAVAAACGGEPSRPEGGGPVAVERVAASAEGEIVVAEVNGRPVFASCVSVQAATYDIPVREALQQCIDFELLAQEAERRGYGADDDLAELRKRESVRAMLGGEFEPSFDGPEDVPQAEIEQLWSSKLPGQGGYVRDMYNHEEYRRTEYVLVKYPGMGKREIAPRDSPSDLRAREVAQQFYDLVKDTPLMLRDDFYRAADEVAADNPDVKVDRAGKTYATPRKHGAVEPFAAAAFSMQVGDIHPPVRSQFGYFVIMLVGVLPEKHVSLAEATPELREKIYEPSRAKAFLRWADALVAARAVSRDDARLEAVRVEDPELGVLPELPKRRR